VWAPGTVSTFFVCCYSVGLLQCQTTTTTKRLGRFKVLRDSEYSRSYPSNFEDRNCCNAHEIEAYSENSFTARLTLVPGYPDCRSQCTRSCRGSGLSTSTSCPFRLKRSLLVVGYSTTVCGGGPTLFSILSFNNFRRQSFKRSLLSFRKLPGLPTAVRAVIAGKVIKLPL